MNFKFDEEQRVYTTDWAYDLFEGGYIDPDQLLLDEEQREKLKEAIETVHDFIQQGITIGVLTSN